MVNLTLTLQILGFFFVFFEETERIAYRFFDLFYFILDSVWTSVAALAILGKLNLIDQNKLGWWLSERQLENGGLNGRPEKLEDVNLMIILNCRIRLLMVSLIYLNFF